MIATRDTTRTQHRGTTWLVVAAALSAATALIAVLDPGRLIERHVRGSFPAMTAGERAQEVQGLTSFVIAVGVLGLAFALWSRRRVLRGRPALRTTVPAVAASAVAVAAVALPGKGQHSVLPPALGISAGLALVAGILAIATVARVSPVSRRA